jgi:hypothetical protein
LIRDLSGKTFVLGTVLEKGEELNLDYASTKIALNNNGDKLELIDSEGAVADSISYSSASDDEIIIASRFIEETREISAERPALEEVSLEETRGSISGGEVSAILVAIFLALVAGIVGGLFIKKSEQR